MSRVHLKGLLRPLYMAVAVISFLNMALTLLKILVDSKRGAIDPLDYYVAAFWGASALGGYILYREKG